MKIHGIVIGICVSLGYSAQGAISASCESQVKTKLQNAEKDPLKKVDLVQILGSYQVTVLANKPIDKKDHPKEADLEKWEHLIACYVDYNSNKYNSSWATKIKAINMRLLQAIRDLNAELIADSHISAASKSALAHQVTSDISTLDALRENALTELNKVTYEAACSSIAKDPYYTELLQTGYKSSPMAASQAASFVSLKGYNKDKALAKQAADQYQKISYCLKTKEPHIATTSDLIYNAIKKSYDTGSFNLEYDLIAKRLNDLPKDHIGLYLCYNVMEFLLLGLNSVKEAVSKAP